MSSPDSSVFEFDFRSCASMPPYRQNPSISKNLIGERSPALSDTSEAGRLDLGETLLLICGCHETRPKAPISHAVAWVAGSPRMERRNAPTVLRPTRAIIVLAAAAAIGVRGRLRDRGTGLSVRAGDRDPDRRDHEERTSLAHFGRPYRRGIEDGDSTWTYVSLQAEAPWRTDPGPGPVHPLRRRDGQLVHLQFRRAVVDVPR